MNRSYDITGKITNEDINCINIKFDIHINIVLCPGQVYMRYCALFWISKFNDVNLITELSEAGNWKLYWEQLDKVGQNIKDDILAHFKYV